VNHTTLLLALGVAVVWTVAPATAQEAARPVNVDKINTAADEDNPFVASTSLLLLYASNAAGTWDIMYSDKSSLAKPWSAGKPYAGFAGKDVNECSPFIWRDRFFFATDWIPDEKLKDLKNYDLKQKYRQSAPLILPGISEKEDEKHPWITSLGKEFYFSRKTKEGWTLLVAKGPEPGPIGEPRPVGFEPGFHHATLSASGLTMYVQGPVEKNRVGLYRSKRARAGAAWSKPEPLSSLTNGEAPRGDMSPCLSADGNRLYFASDRPGGKGGLDVWYVLMSQLK
jgi:hypothetical protein